MTGKQATLGYGHKANYTECKYSNLYLHFYFSHISSEIRSKTGQILHSGKGGGCMHRGGTINVQLGDLTDEQFVLTAPMSEQMTKHVMSRSLF